MRFCNLKDATHYLLLFMPLQVQVHSTVITQVQHQHLRVMPLYTLPPGDLACLTLVLALLSSSLL